MTVDTRTRGANRPDDAGNDDDDRDDAQGGDGSGPNPSPPADTSDDDASDDSYRDRFERERRERRRLARRLAEQRRDTADSGNAGERATVAERERDELRGELNRERAYNRILRVATDAGAIDADAVATMLLAADDIEIDDQGRPVDVEEAVRDLLRRKTYLKGSTSGDTRRRAPRGDAGNGRGNGTDEGEQKSDFNSAFRRAATRSRSGG